MKLGGIKLKLRTVRGGQLGYEVSFVGPDVEHYMWTAARSQHLSYGDDG